MFTAQCEWVRVIPWRHLLVRPPVSGVQTAVKLEDGARCDVNSRMRALSPRVDTQMAP